MWAVMAVTPRGKEARFMSTLHCPMDACVHRTFLLMVLSPAAGAHRPLVTSAPPSLDGAMSEDTELGAKLLEDKINVAVLWSFVSGFLGGSARSLFTFKHEMGGYGARINSVHIKFWFLYLVKPFIGIAGGFFFFLLVNLGVVGLYAGQGQSEQALGFLRVVLTSVIGGMYFENIFAILLGMVPSRDSSTNDENEDTSNDENGKTPQ